MRLNGIWLLFAALAVCGTDYEAESGKLLQVTKEAYDGASGGKIVRFNGVSQMDRNKVDPAKPDLEIPFKVDRAGAWKITGTICTETTNNDSVHYRVDDGNWQTIYPGFPRKCELRQLGVYELDAGEHVIRFYRREPKFGLDKISVTSAPMPPLKVVTVPGKPGPDALYTLKARPGSYYLRIFASIPQPGPQRNARITIGSMAPITRRIIFPTVTKGEFDAERIAMTRQPLTVRIQTDKDVTIKQLQLRPVKKILPEAAVNYVPPIKPRADHPRLLINQDILPKVKASLDKGTHQTAWQEICRRARKPFRFAPVPEKEVQWDENLLNTMQCKAFYYLMTGDEKVAREACELAVAYFKVVNFGNGQDICRRTGAAIRMASMVYDWCYPVMTGEERKILRDRFFWQAESMEIGWPPFIQHINTGHGNEAQLNKDLLAMAIAIYDEDPVPWKYCSFRLLEEARAIKNDLYKSGYHYEGVAYGTVRYAADMTAALQLKRATGFDQFEPHAGKVPYAWFYLRTPDGKLLSDGDDYMISSTNPGNSEIFLTANALWPDPKLKAGYMARFSNRARPYSNPVEYLLLVDADQKQDDRLDDLPPVKYFGAPVSLLVARTGWDMGIASEDVLVHLTGAGLHNASHQHLDAGAFQLYYRGLLTSDIGQYRYFSRPYARNFAKTSMAHSVMRLIDPEQKTTRKGRLVDITSGTQEGPGSGPYLPEHFAAKRSFYEMGDVLSVSEDRYAPHLQLDLTKAYPNRAKRYIRTMVFVAAENPALIVFDEVELTRNNIRPVWQITTLDRPVREGSQLILGHTLAGLPSRLTVTTLLPRRSDAVILSGKEAHKVEGIQYHPPFPQYPEANGSRTEITARSGESAARFLHVLQPTPGTAAKPVKMAEKNGVITLSSDGWQVVLAPGKAPAATVDKKHRSIPVVQDALYLDGDFMGKLTDGKTPLLPFLKKKKIAYTEKNGILSFDGMSFAASPSAGKDVFVLSRAGQEWLATPSEIAGILNARMRFDAASGSYFLTGRPGKSAVFSSSVSSGDASVWRALLDGDTVNYQANGKTEAKVVFRQTRSLSGVEICFAQGDVRTARFKIAVSADGKTYQTVFDGRSSGQNAGYEKFLFPARPVRYVRFDFLGNSVNSWNSLLGIRFTE